MVGAGDVSKIGGAEVAECSVWDGSRALFCFGWKGENLHI